MKAEDPKQPRQPWRFTVDGGEPFAFAGICTRKEWEDEEDRGFDDGWLYSATIVTTTPNEVVAPVHDRMPAILPSAEAEAAWLRPGPQRSRTRWRCAAPLDAEPDVERPGQPEAEQGRQRHGRRAGAAGRAADRCYWSPSASSSSFFGFFIGLFFGFFFGFFVDRRRRLLQRASVRDGRLPGAGRDRAGDGGGRERPWFSRS